ncbi:MAG: BatD family protein, partial [Arcobacter sp.]
MNLYFKLFILIIFTSFLYGDVVVKSSDNFILNENYVFEIEADGTDVEFPKIDKIDNYVVSNLGTSRTMTSTNGNVVNKIKKTYAIKPTKEFTFPSFEIKVDGKTIKTKEKLVKEIIPSKTKSKNFDFKISLNKTSLYTGEDAILNM